MDRRSFLRTGKAGLLLLAAPAIVRAELLMPVKPVVGWDVPEVIRTVERLEAWDTQTGIGVEVRFRGETYRKGVIIPNDFYDPYDRHLGPYPSDRQAGYDALQRWVDDLPGALAAVQHA